MKYLLFLLMFWYNTAIGYVGSFTPNPIRNSAEITFIDSQLPGVSCVLEGSTIIFAPVAIQAAACAYYEKRLVIAPISLGFGQILGLQIGATPDAVLGHETRHIFDGNYHPALVPFLDSMHTDLEKERNRMVCSAEHERNLRYETKHIQEQFRVSSKGETKCIIFTNACKVSYIEFGELVRKCLED